MTSLPPTIKAIVFDAYGTLFNVNAIEDELSFHFGEKAGEISATWRRKQLEYTWLRSLMNRYHPFSEVTAEALEYACNAHSVELSAGIRADLLARYDHLDVFAEVPDMLSRLSDMLQLAILSNANHSMLLAAARYNGIEARFRHILSADSIRKYKPTPAVYEIAVKAFGVEPDEIAFVSSNTWDVTGASAYGLFAVWLNRGTQPMESLGFLPSLTLNKLEDLLKT